MNSPTLIAPVARSPINILIAVLIPDTAGPTILSCLITRDIKVIMSPMEPVILRIIAPISTVSGLTRRMAPSICLITVVNIVNIDRIPLTVALRSSISSLERINLAVKLSKVSAKVLRDELALAPNISLIA